MIKNNKDWHVYCKKADSREYLENLCNPSSSHEHALWNISNLKDINIDNLPEFLVNNNFEDYLGIYAILDSNLSHESIQE